MQAHIQRGKLVPPKTLTAGMQRRKQLEFEIKRITEQVADPTRTERFLSKADYDGWRTSAGHALRMFETELRLLNEWLMVRQNNAELLLRDAYEMLKALEVSCDDFDSKEMALMERLDSYFDKGEEDRATG